MSSLFSANYFHPIQYGIQMHVLCNYQVNYIVVEVPIVINIQITKIFRWSVQYWDICQCLNMIVIPLSRINMYVCIICHNGFH